MRLGNSLKVTTATKTDTHYNILTIDWNRFSNLDAMIEDIDVTPHIGKQKDTSDFTGTTIEIGDLIEDWSRARIASMVDHEFSRLTDPFTDQKSRPRIAIYCNGSRLSIPWLSSHLLEAAHAKISGVYQIQNGEPSFTCTLEAVNLGYEHPREIQTITLKGQDLESLLVGAKEESIHYLALESVGEFSFEAAWFNRRRLTGVEGIGDLKTVRDQLQKWSGILLFRDRFRVFPYGEDEDDWLSLDRRALGRSGYTLNKTQFIGRSVISRTQNPYLMDQTNREGLRHTPEREVFIGIIQYSITHLLFNFLKEMDQQYKSQKVDLSDAKEQVADLETRAADCNSSTEEDGRERRGTVSRSY